MPQGLRFSHLCSGVIGLAGLVLATLGRAIVLAACAAVIPGFMGAATGVATWPFDFAIAAVWAGF